MSRRGIRSSSVCIHAAEALEERTEKAASEFTPKAKGKRLGRNGAKRLAPAYKAQAIARAKELGVTSKADALSRATVVDGNTVFTFDTGDVLIVENIADPSLLRDDIVIL